MVPSTERLRLLVLKLVANKEVHTRTLIETLADNCRLSEEERNELLPNSRKRKFDNQVYWVKSHLKQKGLLEYPKPGYSIATEKGRRILANPPKEIYAKLQEQFK